MQRKFAKDTFWLTASQGVMIISGFLINIVISHEFSQAELGTFNQVLGIYMILTVLFSLGVNTSITQKVASSIKENKANIFSSGIFITLISSFSFLLILYFVLTYFPYIVSTEEVKRGLLVVFFAIPIFNLNKNFMALYTGLREQIKFSTIRSLRWCLIISFISLNSFLFKEMSANYYAFLFTEIIIFIYVVFDKISFLSIRFTQLNILENLSFGIKSFIAELFAVLNKRLDIVIIGYYLTQSETGVFSFYIYFVKVLYIFPGILQQNINPIFAKYWKKKNITDLNKKLIKLKKANIFVIAVLSVLLILFYYVLVSFFREEYYYSLILLVINMLCAIPAALISWGGGLLIMAGKLKENILRTIIILIVNTSLLLVLSSNFGIYGAALGTSLGFIFTFFMLFAFVKNMVGINLLSIR